LPVLCGVLTPSLARARGNDGTFGQEESILIVSARPSKIAMGFDGGGTKTDCVVLDDEGKVMGRGAAGPSNPLRTGFDAAFKELAQAAAQALAGAQLRPRQIHSVCAGLAGAAQRSVVRKMMLFLAHEFPEAFAHVTADGDIALEAAVGVGPGVVIIAGTGSSVLGRNAVGETARAGGFGRSIGDEGSAYEMGRRAVASMARARDQVVPGTPLGEMIPAAFDGLGWEQLAERIANNPDDVFPRIFPVVVKAAQAHDATAQEILFDAALSLSSMALAVIRRLGMQETEFLVAKSGGVHGVTAILDGLLDSLVLSAAPRAQILRLETQPAVGAARLAARLAGDELPATSHPPTTIEPTGGESLG
jgi:glucosamine kinase